MLEWERDVEESLLFILVVDTQSAPMVDQERLNFL